MADAKKMQLAKDTFATLCRTLDKNDWKYRRDDEQLRVSCGARGDDLSMDLEIIVDADRQLVMLLSFLPVTFSEDKRIEGALAATAINRLLINGCFDYDLNTGRMIFRMPSSFMGSLLGEEAFKYILYASCQIVDEYNDKLLMLAKGMLTLEQFIAAVNN